MFSHLDLVEAALVRQVNTVAAGLGELSDRPVRQALAAFSFITIPSIRDCRARMLLYLETAQVSMMNGCLGQAEGCCRALNSLILEGEIPPQNHQPKTPPQISLLVTTPGSESSSQPSSPPSW